VKRAAGAVRSWGPTIAFGIFAAVALHYMTAARVVKLSGPLPAFSARTLSGETLNSDGLRGKVAILNFWSPG
jgi:hypothetical protein